MITKSTRQLNKIRKKTLLFNELLHSLRIAEEMSQVELAALTGTTKSKICDFEKGRRTPTLEIAAKLAKALGHSEVLFITKLIQEQLKRANLNVKVIIEAA